MQLFMGSAIGHARAGGWLRRFACCKARLESVMYGLQALGAALGDKAGHIDKATSEVAREVKTAAGQVDQTPGASPLDQGVHLQHLCRSCNACCRSCCLPRKFVSALLLQL